MRDTIAHKKGRITALKQLMLFLFGNFFQTFRSYVFHSRTVNWVQSHGIDPNRNVRKTNANNNNNNKIKVWIRGKFIHTSRYIQVGDKFLVSLCCYDFPLLWFQKRRKGKSASNRLLLVQKYFWPFLNREKKIVYFVIFRETISIKRPKICVSLNWNDSSRLQTNEFLATK